MMRVPGRGELCVAVVCALGMLAGNAKAAGAQPRIEVRGFWVDTFNTALNNHADVALVVDRALAANANTIFAQVRRRGDSWYLNSLEPLADRTPIQPGFDPLQDLIVEAHGRGLEVHAFVIANAIWNRAPNLFPPVDPNHVFNRHGGYDPATNTITPGPDNWLTRTLIPDGTAGITLQGHRFVSDFYIDPGIPTRQGTPSRSSRTSFATTRSTACISIASAFRKSASPGRPHRPARASATTPRALRGFSATMAFRPIRRRPRRTIPCGASGGAIK